MALSKLHYINTGKDGVLDHTSPDDVDRLFEELKTKDKIALHFHGGLVSEQSGMAAAERLLRDCYDPAGVHSVFFVWESGLLEVLKHNMSEIFGEDMFKILLKWVLKFAVGKIVGADGSKGPGVHTVDDMEVYAELSKKEQNIEPFNTLSVPSAVSEVTPDERASFEAALENDNDFQETVIAIANSLVPETKSVGEKGITLRTRRSIRTLMSPAVVEQLKTEVEQDQAKGAKGIFATASMIKAAADIFVRVFDRFRSHRDHGIYPTVVEEILRQFYVANVGTAIWSAMKKETADTFDEVNSGTPRGGWYFLKKLQELLAVGRKPEISLVGHSTGAVFINNLIAKAHEMQSNGVDALPADFVFKNVVFLAPACTFEHFLASATKHRQLFKNFRMFTMTDEAESHDVLVPFAYTRSLLYLISGILEPAPDNMVDFDKPIVGMQRYYDHPDTYKFTEVATARTFLQNNANSLVWSPVRSDPGQGLYSTALKHGDFDDDENTLASVRYILSH